VTQNNRPMQRKVASRRSGRLGLRFSRPGVQHAQRSPDGFAASPPRDPAFPEQGPHPMNLMIRGAAVVAFACLLPLLAGGAGAPPSSGGSEQDWVSLFDGKTMSGWTMLQLRAGGKSQWEV